MIEAYIRLTAPITPNSTERLFQIIDQKYKSGVDKLHLLLSTPGGSVAHGISIYNYLRGLPIEIITCNIGTVDSIGVIIYCAGEMRISVPNARFFLHPIGLDVLQPTRVDEHWLKETQSSLRIDQANIAKIIAATTGKESTAIEHDISERKSLFPDEAIKYGLVKEIASELLPREADLTPIYESEAYPPSQKPIETGASSEPENSYSTYKSNMYAMSY